MDTSTPENTQALDTNTRETVQNSPHKPRRSRYIRDRPKITEITIIRTSRQLWASSIHLHGPGELDDVEKRTGNTDTTTTTRPNVRREQPDKQGMDKEPAEENIKVQDKNNSEKMDKKRENW